MRFLVCLFVLLSFSSTFATEFAVKFTKSEIGPDCEKAIEALEKKLVEAQEWVSIGFDAKGKDVTFKKTIIAQSEKSLCSKDQDGNTVATGEIVYTPKES